MWFLITLSGDSPATAATKPFNQRQLKAVDLRAEGLSYDSIAQAIQVTPKTIREWKKNPEWDRLLKQRQESWSEEYELAFSRLMPKASRRHDELLDSQSEAIRMRAVDSAHSNSSRHAANRNRARHAYRGAGRYLRQVLASLP